MTLIHVELVGGKYGGEIVGTYLQGGEPPVKIRMPEDHFYLRVPGTLVYVPDPEGSPSAEDRPARAPLSSLRPKGPLPSTLR